MLHSIKIICICGAGTMGSGIAQLSAQAGFMTILYDVNTNMLAKGQAGIEKSLQFLLDKNKITAVERSAVLSRLQFTTHISHCVADVFIEAIIENTEAKTALFKQLDAINQQDVIFATNTSSLPITAIASGVPHPERVAGLHFFNPAPVMKLVEVVQASQTSPATIETLMTLARHMNKLPVLCKDAPGFIVNHVARPYYLEALRLMAMGIAPETIDNLMLASGFKMGPFRLMDLIGNDINYAVSCSLYEALGKPARLEPSTLQKDKVEKGELGRKTGKGYYLY